MQQLSDACSECSEFHRFFLLATTVKNAAQLLAAALLPLATAKLLPSLWLDSSAAWKGTGSKLGGSLREKPVLCLLIRFESSFAA